MAEAEPLTFIEHVPGVFVVRYVTAADLAPDRQGPLIDKVRRRGADAPVALVFVLSPSVWRVDAKIPLYWLDVTADRALQLRAMAIVSPSVAVRAAALGFAVTNTLRRMPVTVKTFTDEATAIVWAQQALAKPA